MSINETIEHEVIKRILKLIVYNNNSLTHIQKQYAMNKIDEAAMQADWLMEMLKC